MGKCDVEFREDIPVEASLKPDWIRGEFVSGTICATDRSNARGLLNHVLPKPEIIGHECCFRVIASNHKDIPSQKR